MYLPLLYCIMVRRKKMAKKFKPQIKKLQNAINEKFDSKLLINTTQFYSKDTKRMISMIVIKQAQWDEEKQKYKNVELFASASDIQIVLWLRDYWYTLNDWEIPQDNPKWLEARRKYEEKNGKSQSRKL